MTDQELADLLETMRAARESKRRPIQIPLPLIFFHENSKKEEK